MIYMHVLSDFGHGLVKVDFDDRVGQVLFRDFRQVLCRVALQLLQEDAVLGDLAQGLAIRAARHSQAHLWSGCVGLRNGYYLQLFCCVRYSVWAVCMTT